MGNFCIFYVPKVQYIVFISILPVGSYFPIHMVDLKTAEKTGAKDRVLKTLVDYNGLSCYLVKTYLNNAIHL